MILTELQIQKLYKIASLVTIGLGLVFIAIPSATLELTERIWPAILLNIGFHLFFQVISRMPAGMNRLFQTQDSIIKTLGPLMLKIWVITAIGFTILATFFIILRAFLDSNYQILLVIPIFFAIVIAAISSWNKITE
ncbi:membrane hypothetical protein [Marinoscillum sp. 108]|nr:membrane hypothetical protein [Marinoscillum sp. 108]